MARPIADEQRRQWASVYAQTLALAEFFGRQRPQLVEAIAGYAQPSPPVGVRLRGLRVARNDFLEWAGYLGGDELRALDQHLRARIGQPLDSLQAKRLSRIAAVLEKGRITTDDQLRLLKGRHEQIWDEAEHATEAAKLNQLLEDYELRKRT